MHGVKKKEEHFYDLFCSQIDGILEAGEYFYNWLLNYDGNENVEAKANKICEMEKVCDEDARKILREVNKSFITPFDREDIFELVNNMDRIVDVMDKTASRLYLYNIDAIRPLACKQAEINLQCIKELKMMFENLKNFKKSDVVLKQIIEVNRLENVGDNIYRQALKELFQGEQDPVEIIKWQNIYECLEKGADVCEVVANTVEGVVMKYA